jgi:SAM-dependent methyltransferase
MIMIFLTTSKASLFQAGNYPYAMDFFETAYHDTPPWDIGRAQQEFVHLEESGKIIGDVLDVGCGTGENALFLASRSHNVWGVDSAPAAIDIAQKKAKERGLDVTFLVKDTFKLYEIGRIFDTIIDSGLFHTLSDPDRPFFVRNLSEVLKPGGTYFMLAFSELEPGGYGPRRITKKTSSRIFLSYSSPLRPALLSSSLISNSGSAISAQPPASCLRRPSTIWCMYTPWAGRVKMVRTQIYLDQALKKELSRISQSCRITVSGLIRQASCIRISFAILLSDLVFYPNRKRTNTDAGLFEYDNASLRKCISYILQIR